MNLSFDYLYIERFRSFDYPAELDLYALQPGVHFVRGINKVTERLGSNGAGKSSIFDAIVWCLYGKTVQGLASTDVRPWEGKGQTIVELTLYVDDEKHVVTRTAGPNSLLLDDKEASQETIDRLIGLTMPAFVNTLLIGQNRPLFFDLMPREKMKILGEAIDLDRWDYFSETAGKVADELEALISEISSDLAGYERDFDDVTEEIKRLRRRADEWQAERNRQQQDAKKLIAQHEAIVKKAQPILDDALLEEERAALELKDFKQLRNERDAGLFDLRRDLAELDQAVTEYDQLLESLRKPHPTCPTCGQRVLNKVHAEKHLTKKWPNIKALKKDRDDAEKELSDTIKEINKIDKDIAAAENREDAAQITIRRLQPDIAAAKAAADSLRDVAKIDEVNPYSEQAREQTRRLGEFKRKIEDGEAELKAKQRELEINKFWVQGFKDIKLYIVEELLQELELATNAMLDEFGLVGWEVRYDVEKETQKGTMQRGLTVTVLSPKNNKWVRWEVWSGGEGQRLRLIGALALAEVLLNYCGVTPDMEVLDEPTKDLSAEGRDDLAEALADRARRLDRRIIFVDHATVESAKFASTLTVINDSSGSRIAPNAF